MEVEILSRKMVKPSTPTPQRLRYFKISSFDQLASAVSNGSAFYYLANEDEIGVGERERRLEESLARVLDLYYPLAGRYLSDKLIIDCNDEGVELLGAKVSCELSQVLRGEFTVEELNCLFPGHFESASSSVAAFQVNVFDCGGIVIGTMLSHRLFDGHTASQFINAWATSTREGSTDDVPRPDFQLASLFPAKEGLPELKHVGLKDGVKLVTRRFVFNREAITRLKAMARNGGTSSLESLESQFSRVEVLSAVIWKAIIQAAQATNNQELSAGKVFLAANLRGRTKLPILQNSFGNALMPAVAKFTPSEGERHVEFSKLVRLIHNAIRTTVVTCSDFVNGDDLFMRAMKARTELNEERGQVDIYNFTSLCGFPFYDVDFGWGKPAWVGLFCVPRQRIALMSTKDREGVAAWLTLDEETMLLVQQAPDMIAHTSQVRK